MSSEEDYSQPGNPNVDERVGYGRPPLASRFRPGQSGNPRGRPKGARNLNAVLASALGERVAVTENGRRRRITKLEAAIKQIVNRAAAGEARATALLIQRAQANEAKASQPDTERVGEADAIVMAELQRRESLQTLAHIRATIGEYNFAGQYQQTPAPAGGGMVKEAWFRRYRSSDRPETFNRVVQSWDTANKPTELADYSVCTTWGLKGPNFYLLNVFRKKLSFPDLKRAVIEQDRLFHPEVILIEDKASGTQLIQDLIEAGLSRVKRYKPEGDKIMRLHAQTATIENGFVYLPEEAHWLADFISELTMFPAGRHDDQVDSTAQALAWTKIRPPGWGILEYYRLEAERVTSRQQ